MSRTLKFFVYLSLFLAGSVSANEARGGGEPSIVEAAPLSGFRVLNASSIPLVENGRIGRAISLPRGLELLTLETKSDESLGDLIRLGIDQGNESLPADIWVRAQDLENQDFLPYDFSPADETAEPGIWKRMTYCYRYVKNYLLKTGQVKTYLPGGSAYQAASILPKHGFRRTGHRPTNAQDGEICVYGGGPQGHGHIEVKRGGKWWYGYGFINHPIQNRRFIACFVK